MFGLGTTELIILLAILVLLFGSSKLPQLGAGLGQGIRNFKKSIKGDRDGESKPEISDKSKDEHKS